jgi:transcriptional regulator GlxA family with amidase domain
MWQRVLADHSWDSAPEIDVLVYPGGAGASAQVGDEEVRAWVRSIHERARLTTSVCTGAFILADAGLLKGRPATTHWDDFDELLEIDGSIEARREARFVDDGDIITAAGISAGIDMALHLIARLHSEDRAREIKRRLKYEPDPSRIAKTPPIVEVGLPGVPLLSGASPRRELRVRK